MNEINLMPDMPDLTPPPKTEAVPKVPHKITICIEDINVNTDEMALDVKFDPKMEANVPMTAALSVAEQVLGLLSVVREKALDKAKSKITTV